MPPDHNGHRIPRRAGSLVLEYHAVSESWDSALAVRPEQLRHQLEHLLGRGYVGTTLADAALRRPDDRVVAVTFDDAYHSVYERAYPILRSLGVPGTVFVVTEYAEQRLPLLWPRREPQQTRAGLETELRGMSWDELAELSADGWEVGSHTMTHPRLTTLSDRDLERELRGSRNACEQALGRPCASLAYPFGDVDERVARMAAAAGYAVAAIEDPGPRDPFLWPRVGIYRADTMPRFRLKISPATRAARAGLATLRRRLRERATPTGVAPGPDAPRGG